MARSLDADRPEGYEGRLFLVAFDLPAESSFWPPAEVERLWVAKTPVKFEVSVLNSPFFVRGIAYGDVIRVRADHDRRELVFEEFVRESGNSTVRLISMSSLYSDELESIVRAAGCSWNVGGLESYAVVNIPPEVNYEPLRRRLLEMKQANRVGIQESAISSIHRSQLSEFP